MDVNDVERLRSRGDWAGAESTCRLILRDRPDDHRALHRLAAIVLRRGEAEEAVALLLQAVRLVPADPSHRIDLAAALGTAGRPTEALDYLNAALLLRPDVPELHNNLGVTLEKLGRGGEAVKRFRAALALRERYPEAHYNLGRALRTAGRVAEAASEFHRALVLRPQYLKAAQGLASAAAETGDVTAVLAALRNVVDRAPESAGARSALLYSLHNSNAGPETLYREHREWGRRFCEPARRDGPRHVNDRAPDRKLRVGYVSPDLREHTPPKFIEAALCCHDPGAVELTCYSDTHRPDAVTERLRAYVEHWYETRLLSDSEFDALIRQHRIDILVDLRGHAADNRLTLFARKPAPVQATMVGYFNTTGLSDHYCITDDRMDPSGRTEHLHTETLVRLPYSCWCYTPDEDAPQVAEPPALKNGYVTFGSLNKIVKVSEPCARLWAKVFEAVPRSRLLLSVAGEDAVKPVRERLASYGSASDRLILLGKTRGSREYLERFAQIDICLDTFPFNGITTTCEGLWMGVPCVSLGGETTVSRAGKSILHAANLPELATDTPEQFVTVATELASDLPRLRELRLGMRGRLLASPLMDHRRFARDLEAAYRQMWREWCGADRHQMATASSGLHHAGQ